MAHLQNRKHSAYQNEKICLKINEKYFKALGQIMKKTKLILTVPV